SNSELTTLRLPASSDPAVGSLVTIDGTNYLEAITDETAFRFWIAGFQYAQQATTNPAFSLTDTNGWVPVQPGQQWLFSSMCMSSVPGSRGRYQWTYRDAQGNDITAGNGEYGAYTYFPDADTPSEALQTVT